ncbi:hypothetical protein BVC80_9095g142 [Macleaya cordata]|uniref:Uncharacterized protein n=1 Tax=Macleaya cordata TaxID=56857 RepID=A0A200PXL2_MACCD|nr:hypothetical protein BVC80_9095g142 [Macleaya cordata]
MVDVLSSCGLCCALCYQQKYHGFMLFSMGGKKQRLHDETIIIGGALELIAKTAKDAMPSFPVPFPLIWMPLLICDL